METALSNKEYCTEVNFSSIKSLTLPKGKGALIGKKDIKSAFRHLPIYPGDFDLLGFKIGSNYYIDKCLPMGCSINLLGKSNEIDLF
jgi:hypothetical protein